MIIIMIINRAASVAYTKQCRWLHDTGLHREHTNIDAYIRAAVFFLSGAIPMYVCECVALFF